jgi:hypothetical protein
MRPTARHAKENPCPSWALTPPFSSGHLLFERGGRVFAVPFDLHRLEVSASRCRFSTGKLRTAERLTIWFPILARRSSA